MLCLWRYVFGVPTKHLDLVAGPGGTPTTESLRRYLAVCVGRLGYLLAVAAIALGVLSGFANGWRSLR
jgi:hypothetical protein